jgi:competence protein ComEA
MEARRPLEDRVFLALLAALLVLGGVGLWPHLAVRFAPARLVVQGYAPEKVSLNRASLAELESLPGVGPALARRIVAHRPYLRPEDLARVPGIGPKLFAKILPLVSP